jgi:hypothetical protein
VIIISNNDPIFHRSQEGKTTILNDVAEWNTEATQKDFEFLSFSSPYAFVVRKIDNVKGSLKFNPNEHPRLYRNFINGK